MEKQGITAKKQEAKRLCFLSVPAEAGIQMFLSPLEKVDPDVAPILVCPVVPSESLSSTRSGTVIQSFLLDPRIREDDREDGSIC